MQIRKRMKRIQGPGRYAHVTVIFEFFLNYTMLTTLAVKANVRKSKINSAKKLPSVGIETSCDPL